MIIVLRIILAIALCQLCLAQQFQHVIIVIQENRSTDNLFGASGIPGADVVTQLKRGKVACLGTTILKGPNLSHNHQAFLAESNGIYPKGSCNYVSAGIQPYWDIASQYGFANYMFQTNQGESYPAHQFLFAGTSATDNVNNIMVSDNNSSNSAVYGCVRLALVPTLAPDGTVGSVESCYNRAALPDLITAAGLSWHFYASSSKTIWNAPASDPLYYGNKALISTKPQQILTDIATNKLANVVWITPAGAYSDHGGENTGGGPAWVASIVNAVGQSPYWQNTAILITWDDWGGWWDHVAPLANNTGWCSNYCYGFRVPLLVVSAQTPTGYVDNNIHDFGSILHFVETNFGLPNIGPGGWADAYADNLSEFFTPGESRSFTIIQARPLTKKELADRSDPDND